MMYMAALQECLQMEGEKCINSRFNLVVKTTKPILVDTFIVQTVSLASGLSETELSESKGGGGVGSH